MGKLKLVLDSKAILGEGPFWDEKKQCLFWVDIIREEVHIFNPETGIDRTINIGEPVGTIVIREQGGAVLALKDGFAFLDLESEKIEYIVKVEEELSNNRFNDGKCDPEGRFWAGTMGTGEKSRTGALYCLDTNLNVRKMLEDVSISNGLAWSPDNKTMYYIDTPTREVVAFDYELDTGEITNKRIALTLSDNHGKPDGMTIDKAGNLWIAEWGGGQISQWNPMSGKLLDTIEIPASLTTSCTFGGKELNELYITTARVRLNKEELRKYPKSGGLFKFDTGVKGIKSYKFKG